MNILLQYLPSRHYIILLGTVIAVTIMILLMLFEYKFTWRMAVIAVMSIICTIPGAVFGEIARKLTYGEWLNMADFVRNMSEYEGTHYMGRAIYTAATGLILWRLVMRKNKGTFAKDGQGRFLDILSVFMGIQTVIVRIGCLKEGCCWGKAYYGALSVMSPYVGYRVYPAVHTELIISTITLIFIIIMYKKRKSVFSVFCVGYGLAVFIAEYMYDRAGTVSIVGLTAIQLLAVCLITIGIVYACLTRRKPVKIDKKIKGGRR